MPAVHEGLLERELDARAALVRSGREDARHDLVGVGVSVRNRGRV